MGLSWFPANRRGRLRLTALLLLTGGGGITGISCMISMPGRSHSGPLPPLTTDEAALRGRLERHVRKLAGDIGERNVWTAGTLDAAAAYLRGELATAGYAVAEQTFEANGQTVRNLEAERKGTTASEEIVIVGAHYDSVPGSPGADDNATGVAAVLEIAKSFASGPATAKTVRFVAFVNEEPPFFQTGEMGSRVCARRCRERNENVVAMLSLETIGYYADAEGSQKYPAPFGWFFPNRGDFIGFVGNFGSRALVRRAIGSFRAAAAFPSEGVAAPAALKGIGWSDQWAFWQEGYPALMVTDTAPFRNPNYHTTGDTPDTIDYDRLARVTAGLAGVVRDLAAGDR